MAHLACDEEMLSPSESPADATGEARGGRPGEGCNLLRTVRPEREDWEEMHNALRDPMMVNDRRVLTNMLRYEEHSHVNLSAFTLMQKYITPEMRTTLTTWMYEVCCQIIDFID